jgi:hypothetical protein
VQYFNNKSAMMISIVNHGEFINWAIIKHSELVKELIRWEFFWKNMIKGTTKREPKKDLCHSTIILKVMFQKWFPLKRSRIVG